MLRVADYFKQVGITPDTFAVFRRADTLAGQTDGILDAGFRR
jgi:thiamine biosynthesis lipoprotein ApbE